MEECENLDYHFPDFIEEDSSEQKPDLQFTTENICKSEIEEKFTCYQCFSDFETHFDLLNHIEIEHFTFVCEKCNKQFPTDKRLKKHLSDSHLSRKFPCPLCDKLFTRKDLCKDHIYSHSEKPLFHCKFDKCDKVFRKAINLKQHETIHTGIYRKKCPICNAIVTQLSKHLNSHLNEKQHQCKSCDKAFTRRSYLEEHEKVHHGEVGFICDQCQMEFKSKNAVYKHKRSKHSAECYICEIPECRQEFNRKDNMVSHMKRMHKLIVESVGIGNPN